MTAHYVGFALAVGFLVLLVQGIPIWIAARAEPVGDKPYRWGTYIGILVGLIGIGWFWSIWSILSAKDIYGGVTFAFIGICSVLASIGILQRKRFGAVMFLVDCLVVLVAAPIREVIWKHAFTAQELAGWVLCVLPVLVMAVPTTVYFKRRWWVMR